MPGPPPRPEPPDAESAPTLAKTGAAAGTGGASAAATGPGSSADSDASSSGETDVALARTAPLPALRDRAPADDLPPGSRLGPRYRIVRTLGLGGMGAVYLAIDEVLGKEVALKVLRPKLAERLGFGALRDEVLLAQKVTHPNVCRIYDLEEVAGQYLLKMEYLDGETLSQQMDRGPVEVAETLRIGRGIAAGLEAAHREGVVHRDLKPQNVMVEARTGRVVLMDFGLARSALPSGGDEAADATVSGTPEYMSPEQARGEKLDGRADLYALGALLYHLLVGQLPFPQARALLRAGRPITAAAPDPRHKRPDAPPWLGRLILRLLEKDPARRPVDARAVGRLLEGPRHVRIALLGAATAISIAALVAFSVVEVRGGRAAFHPHLVELPAWEENADMPSFSPDGTMLAYLSDRDGAWRIYVEPLAGQVADRVSRPVTPAKLDGAALDPDLPRWARDGSGLFFVGGGDRAFRVGLDGGPPRVFLTGVKRIDECGANRFAIVYASSPGCARCERLVLRSGPVGAAVDRELLQLPVDQAIDFLRCDPKGEQIVYTRSPVEMHTVQHTGDLFVVPVAGGASRRLTNERERNRYPSYPIFAPDGRTLIFSSARAGPTNLWEMPIGGGAAIALTSGEGPDLAPAISPDGTKLVYDVDVTAVPIFAVPIDPATGAVGQRRRIAPSLDDAATVLATPDGLAVVAAVRRHGRPKIVAIPLGEGPERALADGETPALAPVGGELVYSTSEGDRGALFRVALDAAEGGARLIAQFEGHVASVMVGPDRVVHFSRARARAVEAWRVPLAGGEIEPDAPPPVTLVVPAPRGDYKLAILGSEAGPAARVVPGGRAIDDPRLPSVGVVALWAWDASGESFVYWDGAAAHRHVVRTGTDRVLFAEKDLEGLAVSPDGATLYLSTPVGHVRRHLIDNFAERPRPLPK